jgi:hypothetical protein
VVTLKGEGNQCALCFVPSTIIHLFHLLRATFSLSFLREKGGTNRKQKMNCALFFSHSLLSFYHFGRFWEVALQHGSNRKLETVKKTVKLVGLYCLSGTFNLTFALNSNQTRHGGTYKPTSGVLFVIAHFISYKV